MDTSIQSVNGTVCRDEPGNTNIRPKRAAIACTECRRRQVRCASSSNPSRCRRCEKMDLTCTFVRNSAYRTTAIPQADALGERWSSLSQQQGQTPSSYVLPRNDDLITGEGSVLPGYATEAVYPAPLFSSTGVERTHFQVDWYGGVPSSQSYNLAPTHNDFHYEPPTHHNPSALFTNGQSSLIEPAYPLYYPQTCQPASYGSAQPTHTSPWVITAELEGSLSRSAYDEWPSGASTAIVAPDNDYNGSYGGNHQV